MTEETFPDDGDGCKKDFAYRYDNKTMGSNK